MQRGRVEQARRTVWLPQPWAEQIDREAAETGLPVAMVLQHYVGIGLTHEIRQRVIEGAQAV